MKAKDLKPGDFIQLEGEDYLRYVSNCEHVPDCSLEPSNIGRNICVTVPILNRYYFNPDENVKTVRLQL